MSTYRIQIEKKNKNTFLKQQKSGVISSTNMFQGCNISRKINTISTFIAMLWFYSDVSVLKWVGNFLNLILKRYVTRPEYDYECVLVSLKSYDHIRCLDLFYVYFFYLSGPMDFLVRWFFIQLTWFFSGFAFIWME